MVYANVLFKIYCFMRFLCVLTIFLLLSCVERTSTAVSIANNEENGVIIDPFYVRAQEITGAMDDRLLVSQILISGIDGLQGLSGKMVELLTEIPSGGIMLFRYNLNADNDTIHALLAQTSSLIKNGCGVPPFIAVDHEGGGVNRFRRGVAALPAASSYWDFFLEKGMEASLEKIETDSFKAGGEIIELGVNMNFAPVAEYLIDENRIFLKNRSYGPDPFFTSMAVCAFVNGMEQAGVLCVIKHFPASAGLDPHHSASVLNMKKESVDSLILPFYAVIKNGARAIMAAHTLVPLVDSEIASLSSVIMKNWLRDELGFDGIIISDDFIMAAAGNLSPEEAAVRSVCAGSDMILVWPANLKKTHQAFIAALEDGQLSRERLQDAVQRIIYEKLKMGLIDGKR
jgi:beta-N-acetylhexosaminidase